MSLFITIYVVWGFLKMVTGTDIDIEEHCGLENTDQWGQRKKKKKAKYNVREVLAPTVAAGDS